MIRPGEYAERLTTTGSTTTRLPPAQWETLLALADAFGFRLPGPDKRRTVNQVLVLWQRVLRTSEGPQEHYYTGRFWWSWPRRWAHPGRTHRTRSPLGIADARLLYNLAPADIGTFVTVSRFEAWIVLLAAVVEEECSREHPRLTMPEPLLAESSRLLVSGRVEYKLA